MHENVADLLVVAARRFGQRTAIVRGRQVRSFGELEIAPHGLRASFNDAG